MRNWNKIKESMEKKPDASKIEYEKPKCAPGTKHKPFVMLDENKVKRMDVDTLVSLMENGAFDGYIGLLIDRISKNHVENENSELFKSLRSLCSKKEPSQYRSMALGKLLICLKLAEEETEKTIESYVLKDLEKTFEKSKDELVLSIRLCKKLRVKPFRKDTVRMFMKDNELVGEYVASFFAWIADLLPLNFIEIFFENRDACKYYDKVFMKLYKSFKVTDRKLLKAKQEPSTLDSITEPLLRFIVKYPGVRAYLVKNLMYMKEGERLFFITRYLKREDFEYYLNFLVDESEEPERYRTKLQEYLTNGVVRERSSKYAVFMKIYNAMKNDISDCAEGVAGNIRRDMNRDVSSLFKEYDVKVLLRSEIGVIFVSRTIGYVINYIDEIEECGRIVRKTLEINKSEDINKALWNALKTNRQAFIENIDGFKVFEDKGLAAILLHRKGVCCENRLPILDLMKYCDGIYREDTIEYGRDCFPVSEIVEAIFRQDDDERDFLLECVYRKALLGEFDLRILTVEDYIWTDRIFDEMFKTLDDEIYGALVERRPELVFDYCFRHRSLRKRYFSEINKKTCTVEEGISIYKILRHEADLMGRAESDYESYAEMVYDDAEEGNIIYKISVSMNPGFTGEIVEFVYLLTLIRPEEARYYLCEHFSRICKEGNGRKVKDAEVGNDTGTSGVLGFSDLQSVHYVPFTQMMETIFSTHLKNKYFVYTVMDSLLETMATGSQPFKLIILRNMSSDVVTSHHIVRFINVLTSLLHDSNAHICSESKRLLVSVPIASPELICLRSQLVQSILDRMYARPFFVAIRTQLFNHYLCFNGLNLLVQVLNMYIKEFREDIFPILGSLEAFVRPVHLEQVFPIIFQTLSSFVIENTFYLDECCNVASSLMKYGKNASFDRLLSNLGTALRVNKFLVKCLEACEEERVEEIVSAIIERKEHGASKGSEYAVEPFFLAYAPELSIFNRYIPTFMPLLKDLFLSPNSTNQEIAFRAFETMEVSSFLMFCCVVGQWKARLLCIELFNKKDAVDGRTLGMLFILRNDPHSTVRRRALDVWKSKVSNANVALRDSYRVVLGCLRYKNNTESFQSAVMSALNDMATKYDKYIERYVEEAEELPDDSNDVRNPLCLEDEMNELESISEKEVVEIILVECAKLNKHLELALKFSIKNLSVDLFRLLAKNSIYRENIIEVIGKEINNPAVSQIFINDTQLVLDLFKTTKKTFLFKFMNNSGKMELLEALLREEKANKNSIKELMENMVPSRELEQILLNSDPMYISILYSNQETIEDYGCARELFNRAFSILEYSDLKPLVTRKYLDFLLNVSYKNIDDPEALVGILCTSSSLRAFERIHDVVLNMDIKDLFPLCGHLLRNYLVYERREGVLPSLRLIYQRYRDRLGMFGLILERLLLKT